MSARQDGRPSYSTCSSGRRSMADKPGRLSDRRQGSIQPGPGTEHRMQQRTRTMPIVAAVVFALAIAGIVAILVLPSGGSDDNAKPPAAPPQAAPAAGGKVDVSLTDFKITPNVSAVRAGKVTFVARNAGKVEHEMVVVRTDKSAGDLLKGSRASEAGAVDEIGEFAAGRTKRLTLNLKAGHYALICNVPGHYKAGMFTNFVVK